MCLLIKSDQKENERDLNRWFGNRTRFAYVYKILRKWTDEDFYRSVCRDFIWDFEKQKVYQVCRYKKPTEKELKAGIVNKGFHVYTSLKEAKRHRYSYAYDIVVKFRVKREDLVAVDNDWIIEEDNLKQAVCTRLEFVKIVE
jgi:hypothetical protein